MRRPLLAVAIAVVAVAAMIGVVIANKQPQPQTVSTPATPQRSSNEVHDNTMNKKPSTAEPSTNTTAPSSTNAINIKNFDFNPKKVTVKKGTTITWTNQDAAKHDITPDSPQNGAPQSRLLAKGESFSFTFNNVGSFNYHCSPHPYMKASVEVTE